jgi:surface protein
VYAADVDGDGDMDVLSASKDDDTIAWYENTMTCEEGFDSCGVCGGPGIPDGECDCDGNVEDCNGDCGGASQDLDGDGVCSLYPDGSQNDCLDDDQIYWGYGYLHGIDFGSIVNDSDCDSMIDECDCHPDNSAIDNSDGDYYHLFNTCGYNSGWNNSGGTLHLFSDQDCDCIPDDFECGDGSGTFGGGDWSNGYYSEGSDTLGESCGTIILDTDCDGTQNSLDCASNDDTIWAEDECGVCGGLGPEDNFTCDGVFKPGTTEVLQTAVDMWVDDNANALTTYGEINTWDVSLITDMTSLFAGITTFNDDISGWDVSNVTNMYQMFIDAHSFNQSLNDWDVSNVTTMERMFWNADGFDQDLNAWDVSNVENMRNMFRYTAIFNGDISTWDVSNVIDMAGMFWDADGFDQDLNNWAVSNVTAMDWMFVHTAQLFKS